MYDKDGNGSIDLAEMIEIIGTLYEMEGVSKVGEIRAIIVCMQLCLKRIFFALQDSAADRAKKIFGELDVDGDGELTADEFVRGDEDGCVDAWLGDV